MAAENLNGIVIGCTDYRDNDRMLTLFTVERGRIDCKARNCRKPTAPLLACAQPFVYGEYTVYFSGDRGTVNACDLKESFYPLRDDPDRFITASIAARFCLSAVQPDTPNETLFSLLYHTLSYLAYSDTDPSDLLCGYLLHLFDRIGYRPILTQCAVCHRDVRSDPVLFFSAHAGGTVCVACPHGGHPVQRLTLEAMRRILLLQDEELSKIKLPASTRTEVLTLFGELSEEIFGQNDRCVQMLRQFL